MHTASACMDAGEACRLVYGDEGKKGHDDPEDDVDCHVRRESGMFHGYIG